MGTMIILLGPTGAGKSLQATRLERELGYRHISSGALLRSHHESLKAMSGGELVTSEVVERLVEQEISSIDRAQNVILDGFPRVLDEAEWLTSRLDNWGYTLKLVVLLEVSREVSDERLQQRGRVDDTLEALAKKWREYETLMTPVAAYYGDRSLLRRVDGSGNADEVYARLREVCL